MGLYPPPITLRGWQGVQSHRLDSPLFEIVWRRGLEQILARNESGFTFRLRDVPTNRQSTINDLIRQINKFIGVANAIMERYADISEQVRGIQLNQLATDGALRDYFEESGRRDDKLADRIERLERLEILDRTGNAYTIEAQQIRKDIKTEHTDNILRQELAQQIKNLEYVRLKMAKFGVNIPVDLINEAETYTEQIDRIRKELNSG